jgi:hypothetical protein
MKGKLIAGICLAVLALVILGGIIAGAKHHFFTFITVFGLAFALLDEYATEAKSNNK